MYAATNSARAVWYLTLLNNRHHAKPVVAAIRQIVEQVKELSAVEGG
jgi:hypothetical protein